MRNIKFFIEMWKDVTHEIGGHAADCPSDIARRLFRNQESRQRDVDLIMMDEIIGQNIRHYRSETTQNFRNLKNSNGN
jgi:hypothetical protein